MHYFIRLLLGIAILAGAGALYFTSRPVADATGKIHATLYTDASGVWDPQMLVLPFRPYGADAQAPPSSTQLRLEWQKPTQDYNHFLITITDPVNGYTRTESGEHDRISLDPGELQPDTQYVFAIQACLDRRCEKWLVGKDEYKGRTPAAVEGIEGEVLPVD